MATELAQAYVQIMPSADGITGHLTKLLEPEAESAGGKAGTKFSGAFGTALKAGGALVAAGAAAIAGLTAELVKGSSKVAVYGDNIDKMSQKMGLSAQAYQEWDAIMQHSGTSIEVLQSGMKTLANAVENGNAAFERLGITQEQIAAMDNEQLFAATITALQNVESETERTYLAGQLLGRGATELGALLNTSAEETEQMRQRVHELGGVMSDEAVKAAAAYQDSLQDMQTAFSGLSHNLLSEYLPSITTVMDGLTEVFVGNDGTGIAMISEGITGVIDSISDKLPRFLELGTSIVTTLLDAIVSNLPALVEAGAGSIRQIAEGILQNLPEIVRAALEIITTLAQGLAEHIPELIPVAVDVVMQIVDTLTDPDTLAGLLEAALEIIVALAEGLIDALPRLIERVPEIVENLVAALIEAAPMLLKAGIELLAALGRGLIQAIPTLLASVPQVVAAIVGGLREGISRFADIGADMVRGVWEGISSMASWLWSKVSGFFRGIVDGVKNALGIHSPSTVFAGIGENMALGLGDGWSSEFRRVRRDIVDGMSFRASAAVGGGSGAAATPGRVSGGNTYNFYSPKALDPISAAREMKKASQQMAMGLI